MRIKYFATITFFKTLKSSKFRGLWFVELVRWGVMLLIRCLPEQGIVQ